MADEDNGNFVWSIAPRATNVHIMGKILDEYGDPASIWDNWDCTGADNWKVFCID